MTTHPAPPVADSWRRIDSWLARHAPADLALLRPPADPAELAAAEEALGLPLPAELRASLRCHDGATEWTTLLPEQSPLGAAAIVEHRRMRMEDAADVDGFTTRPWDDEPWWHPRWLPWAEDAGGHAHVLDLRPGPSCGRLGWAGHSGGGDFTDSWPGLAAYLHAVAEALRHGGGVRGTYPYLT
ncbi:SMI1/KNR4 family protein, partial [Kitasatospora sp. NPDC057198]|uniref:SMI1/KNR4 family protein n=1 Tax=Kitasatospora sp. NPDC057198 TaxID=3346046 RepID=UPI003626B4F3